jgi:hypothetical protein
MSEVDCVSRGNIYVGGRLCQFGLTFMFGVDFVSLGNVYLLGKLFQSVRSCVHLTVL